MPPDEPGWWYAPAGDWRARLLAPVGSLWGLAAERRHARQQPFRACIPVICVGNFTAGGTGKTPLALLIAREVLGLGVTPVFLTRGYGGRQPGPRFVEPGRDTSRDVGDEALLLAGVAATVVARDRAAGAAAIALSGRGFGAIIMDDGLQNASLAKDLSFAVVDGGRGFGNGLVIPAGPLRAPLPFQMDLADAVVVNSGAAVNAVGDGPGLATDRPTSIADRLRRAFPGPVLEGQPQPDGDVAWLKGARILAYAGIGHPQRFFNLLEACGARIAGTRTFPDHHAFTEADATALLSAAARSGARLVTTQKDHVRLVNALGTPRARLFACSTALPITLTLGLRDLDRLRSLLAAAVKPAGP